MLPSRIRSSQSAVGRSQADWLSLNQSDPILEMAYIYMGQRVLKVNTIGEHLRFFTEVKTQCVLIKQLPKPKKSIMMEVAP